MPGGDQQKKPKPKRTPLDPEWYKKEGVCRPGGQSGSYEHRYECAFKDCCARHMLELTQGSPPTKDVISVRSFVQQNKITLTFPGHSSRT